MGRLSCTFSVQRNPRPNAPPGPFCRLLSGAVSCRRMIVPILVLGVASFIVSWLLTAVMIRLAPRIGFVDRPGIRKIHVNPKPLGGGIAIFFALAIPMVIALVAIHLNLVPLDRPGW